MRTTIELSDEHRAKLLELTARRGEKGFSGVIGEALEAYFEARPDAAEIRRKAGRLRGSINASEARALRETSRSLRENWR